MTVWLFVVLGVGAVLVGGGVGFFGGFVCSKQSIAPLYIVGCMEFCFLVLGVGVVFVFGGAELAEVLCKLVWF
jgi:hypothetical protein